MPSTRKLFITITIISLIISCSKREELILKIRGIIHKDTTTSTPPSNLTGTWLGTYIDSAAFDKTLMRVQMIVTIDNGKFNGVVTARDVTNYPTRTLTGTFNSDTTELTLEPADGIIYENPWKISANTIAGAVLETLPRAERYEYTKQ